MKIRGTIAKVILSVMLLTVAGWVVAAAGADKTTTPAKAVEKPKEVSQTRSASCILRITFDPSVLPLNSEMLSYLVNSTGILGKVTKEVLQAVTYPDVTLSEIGNGGVVPMDQPGSMGGGMGGGMMGMGMGGGMIRGGMMGGMGGGMMGMGGMGGGRTSGMAGGGGGMSMPINPPDAPDAPVAPDDPAAPSTGTATPSSNTPDRNSADGVRNQAERHLQETQRVSEQLQARYGGRSPGYRREGLMNIPLPGPAGSTQDLLIHFELQLSDEHAPAATEAMEAIVNLLSNALARDFDQYRERMAKRADLAEKQADQAEVQVRRIQAQMQELSPSKELNRYPLMDEISNCRDQIRKNQLEDELNRAMVDNLNQQIDEAKKKADVQLVQDPVMKDLEMMLTISKERVEAAKQMVAAGQANQNSLQDAMEKLTRANIELAQRKEQIGVSAGAERINELLKRMSDISLQTTKSRIQLERLKQRIAEADEQLAKSVDYEMLGMRLELAKEKLRESLRRAESMKDNHPEPPLVTPIGAD